MGQHVMAHWGHCWGTILSAKLRHHSETLTARHIGPGANRTVSATERALTIIGEEMHIIGEGVIQLRKPKEPSQPRHQNPHSDKSTWG